jgi:peptidoglycan/LPS O-acetylase OafA/YrhL
MSSVGLGTAGRRLPTLPALDGIRAVAIAAVLLYHSDIFWFPGGLLGVEVFFVLSGYLITSLLLGELQSVNRIRIGEFLTRRARRLLPALFVMLAVVSAIFVAFLPGEVARIRGDVAAAASYTSNWYLIGSDHSYFVSFARPSPFGHLWSLAIEEQFYLLWPPLLLLLWRTVRRRRKIAGTIVAGAAASVALLSLLHHGGDPSRIYYGTDTRAAGLLIGAALAVLWRPFADEHRPHATSRSVDAATIVSGGFLVYAFMRFDDLSSFTYRPGMLLVSLATALLIASCVHPNARIGRVLATAPFRWLGKRSYSVYIWYYPVFVLTRPGVDLDISIGSAFALRLAVTLTLAELSYRFVEQPVRNGALGRAWRTLAERARTPGPLGLRAELAMRGAGLATVTVVISLLLAMVNAPAPTAQAQRSSPVAMLDAREPIEDASSLVKTVGSLPVATPTATVAPAAAAPTDRRVLVLGDSVVRGARRALRERFGSVRIDATVGRQLPDGIERLELLRRRDSLGGTVIIHLGNNGRFTSPQFDRIVRVLRGVERIVFVTVKVPRRWEASVNKVLSAGKRRHPKVILVDWHRLWRTCSGRVFMGDGTHLTAPGARCYARAIARAAGR